METIQLEFTRFDRLGIPAPDSPCKEIVLHCICLAPLLPSHLQYQLYWPDLTVRQELGNVLSSRK